MKDFRIGDYVQAPSGHVGKIIGFIANPEKKALISFQTLNCSLEIRVNFLTLIVRPTPCTSVKMVSEKPIFTAETCIDLGSFNLDTDIQDRLCIIHNDGNKTSTWVRIL